MTFRAELEALFGSPRETHPVPDSEGTPEERLQRLEIRLAQIWDQVWWMRLPWWKRAIYRARGFTDPIERFYAPKR